MSTEMNKSHGFPNHNGEHKNLDECSLIKKEVPMMKMMKLSKVIALAGALSFAVNLAASDGGRSKEQKLTPAT